MPASVFLGVLLVLGLGLWWPSRGVAGRGDLGAGLLAGAVIAFSIALLQIVNDERLEDLEQERANLAQQRNRELQRLADRQDLRLTLGLQPDLTGMDLRGRNLRDYYLRGKELRLADLTNAHLEGADLSGADLRNSTLKDAHLAGATLNQADLRGVVLWKTDFRRASLVAARLEGAELHKTDFRHARLIGVDFGPVDLGGIDLRGANLSGADLREARGKPRNDRDTAWPVGFNAERLKRIRTQVELPRPPKADPAGGPITCGNRCFQGALGGDNLRRDDDAVGRPVLPPRKGASCETAAGKGTWQQVSATEGVIACVR